MTDTTPHSHEYPLSAIVGQEELLLALKLAAVDPSIGGVLIEGPRGSAKSTAARGLAAVLDGPFVNLPLGATEEQVCGTLDLETVLAAGEVRFAPGLLARADGGVLYVDEVNLLPDHLVDILLDAAASGVNHVERDGVSHRHPARFVLTGTMNPDEGELRPQLLDRFGLAVATTTPGDPAQRSEVVARRLAYEDDPAQFCTNWSDEQNHLRRLCKDAAGRLSPLKMPKGISDAIAERCLAEAVEGLRADLILHKATRAQAALRGATEAATEDLEAVAELVLRHRRKAPEAMPPMAEAGAGAGSGAPSPRGNGGNNGNGADGHSDGEHGDLPPRAVAVGALRDVEGLVPKKA